MIVAFTTTLILSHVSQAVQSTNRTLNFQGRLSNATGSVLADGHYNIQFKIYQGGTGTAAGNPGGTLKWTETYVNNGGTGGIQVKNGFFSVSLGSKTAFGSSVDWDSDNLWLSMNVAGKDQACASFNTSGCIADGEMLPMKQITATPYAINAGAVGGKTADNLVQLAQGVQVDASTNTSSIFINKTGSGNLIQLQNTATDVFTVGLDGDLTLGSNADKTISIATAGADTDGNQLTLAAGNGGSGSGSNGGDLVLQGGAAGGTDGNGGDITINAGAGTGTGIDGKVSIGTASTSEIQIGSSALASGTQDITIGGATGAGTQNVVIGSTGSAGGGSTTIQAKDSVSIATNGKTRAVFADNANTVYFGNGVSSAAPDDYTLQGTNSSATAVAGGSLNIQGGNATTGNANGGNVTLSGGSGSGSGADGLVVMSTPTFSTVTNDANCYTSGTAVANDCTVTQASVNNSSAILIGFSATGKTATLPNPTITTAGRIFYVMAAGGSQDFTLRANAGDSAEHNVIVRQNTTVTLMWNGNDWSLTGGSGATTLQDAYNASPQTAGTADITLNGTSGSGGLTIRDSSTDSVAGTLLDVQGANTNSLFSINSNVNELASNPGAETAGGSSSTFPTNTWSAVNTATINRNTTTVSTGQASVRVDATDAYDGVENRLRSTLQPNTRYTATYSVRLESGTFTDLGTYYTWDGGESNYTVCGDAENQTEVIAGSWKRVSCSFTTPSSGITADNAIGIDQASAATRSFYIDNLSVTLAGDTTAPATGDTATPNVQVGGGQGGGATTLFTLDRSSAAPTSTNHQAMLGSMYYDETLGHIQCYEATGWGDCGAKPDTYISLSPEYANAVMNGTDAGTLTSDICSDTLNINDGSSSQPTICGANETYNFYKWTSSEASAKTRSIFVTYQLPTNFKEFITSTTSLKARTNSNDASASYQVYRNDDSGLTACGSSVTASTGSQTSWQTGTASGSADPAQCGFSAGDSIVIRITVSAHNNAEAYISNLGFVFSNQ